MSKENDSLDLGTLDARFDLIFFNDDLYGHLNPLQLDQNDNTVLVLTKGAPSFDQCEADVTIDNIARGYDKEQDGPTLSFDFTVDGGDKQYMTLVFPVALQPAEYFLGAIGTYDKDKNKVFGKEIAGVRDQSYVIFDTSLGSKITRPDSMIDNYPKWSPEFPADGDSGWQSYPFRMGYYTLSVQRLHANPDKNLSSDITEVIVRLYQLDGDQVTKSILICDPSLVTTNTYDGTLTITLGAGNGTVAGLWDCDDDTQSDNFPTGFIVLLDDISDTLQGLLQTIGLASQPNDFFFWKGVHKA